MAMTAESLRGPLRFQIDLKSGLIQQPIRPQLMKGDRKANTVIVALTEDKKPVDLAGVTVTGGFISPMGGAEIPLVGSVSGNEASVTLIDECYAQDGFFECNIMLTVGETTRTILSFTGHVLSKGSGAVIDVGDVIPSIGDIIAQYAEMKRVTQETQEVANAANAAAGRAPYVENGTWRVWDAAAGAYKDTGIQARGPQGEKGDPGEVTLAQLQQVEKRVDAIASGVEIVPTVSGSVIALDDASNLPLRGLTIYGKTTQDGTPTPDNPVELVTAGSGGNIVVNLSAKNMFENTASSQTINGVSFVVNPDGTVSTNGTAAENTTFNCGKMPYVTSKGAFLTGCPSGGSPSLYRLLAAIFNKSGEWLGESADYSYGATVKEIAQGSFVNINIFINKGTNVDGLVFKPMVRQSAFENEVYEPHKGQTHILSTPNGLPGIPVSSGGNYTDANGQQWICDEIDLERGIKTVRTKQFALSNVESWNAWKGHWYNHNYIQDSISTYNAIIGLCSHAISEGKYILVSTICHSDVINDRGVGIQINDAATLWGFTGTTSAEFKAFIDAKNVKLVYACIPEEVKLTEEELPSYRALTTNHPNTTIYNDAGCDQTVRYVADTKLYIDKQTGAAAAAVNALMEGLAYE